MEIAKLKVSGCRCVPVQLGMITAGMVGAAVSLDYTDPIWEGLTKTVVFRGAQTRDVVNAGNVVPVPPEAVSRAGKRLYVGVYGVDGENRLVIPTVWADLGVVQAAADPSGDPSVDPTPEVWEQILQVANHAEAVAKGVRADADAGKFNGATGPAASVTAENIKGALGYTPANEQAVTGLKSELTDQLTGTTALTGQYIPIPKCRKEIVGLYGLANTEVVISSPNLIDPSTLIPDTRIGSGGIHVDSIGDYATPHIQVEPNQIYYFATKTGEVTKQRLKLCDESQKVLNNKKLDDVGIADGIKRFVTPGTCKYIRMSGVRDMMLAKGNYGFDYDDFKSPVTIMLDDSGTANQSLDQLNRWEGTMVISSSSPVTVIYSVDLSYQAENSEFRNPGVVADKWLQQEGGVPDSKVVGEKLTDNENRLTTLETEKSVAYIPITDWVDGYWISTGIASSKKKTQWSIEYDLHAPFILTIPNSEEYGWRISRVSRKTGALQGFVQGTVACSGTVSSLSQAYADKSIRVTEDDYTYRLTVLSKFSMDDVNAYGIRLHKLYNRSHSPSGADYAIMRRNINELFQKNWAAAYGTYPYIPKFGTVSYYAKGQMNKGIPYSNTFIGGGDVLFNRTLSTWKSAILNPASVLYTKVVGDGTSEGNGSPRAAAYGCVCSSFVSYMLGIGIFYNSGELLARYGSCDLIDLTQLEVGDVMYTTGHVAIISDIYYDENWEVSAVEISESSTPVSQCRIYSADEFWNRYNNQNYQIIRVSDKKMTPIERQLYSTNCITEYGDNVVFHVGDTIKLYIADTAATVLLYRNMNDPAFTSVELAALPSETVNEVIVYDITNLISGTSGKYELCTSEDEERKAHILVASFGEVTINEDGSAFSVSGYDDCLKPEWYMQLRFVPATEEQLAEKEQFPDYYRYPAPDGYHTAQMEKAFITNLGGQEFQHSQRDGYYIRVFYKTEYGYYFHDSPFKWN